MPPKTVVIIQNRLLHYRVEFFEQLKSSLAKKGIEVTLIFGQPSKKELVRNDSGALSWGSQIRNSFLSIGKVELIFQWVPLEYWKADLLVLQQENRILSSYLIFVFRKIFGLPVAFWGHGINFQSEHPKGLREKWKRWLAVHADWWFAYTALTEDVLIHAGYPAARITRLNNSIDTVKLRSDLNDCSEQDIQTRASALGIPTGAMVGLFCGSLYREKRLAFLITAADLIKNKLPHFHLIIIGDGPDRKDLAVHAKTRPWLHLLGALVGKEKALYFKMAKVLMNPGLVGLPVIDAFTSGLVMVTTKNAKHSPEIVYLENGKNGLVTEDDPKIYAEAVMRIFTDNPYSAQLSHNAEASARIYTLDAMVENFSNGIERAI